MDKRDFTVIENETKTDNKISVGKQIRQTNPIMKKFAQFHNENVGKFSVKDLFRSVRD